MKQLSCHSYGLIPSRSCTARTCTLAVQGPLQRHKSQDDVTHCQATAANGQWRGSCPSSSQRLHQCQKISLENREWAVQGHSGMRSGLEALMAKAHCILSLFSSLPCLLPPLNLCQQNTWYGSEEFHRHSGGLSKGFLFPFTRLLITPPPCALLAHAVYRDRIGLLLSIEKVWGKQHDPERNRRGRNMQLHRPTV